MPKKKTVRTMRLFFRPSLARTKTRIRVVISKLPKRLKRESGVSKETVNQFWRLTVMFWSRLLNIPKATGRLKRIKASKKYIPHLRAGVISLIYQLAEGGGVSDFLQIAEKAGEGDGGDSANLVAAAVINENGIVPEDDAAGKNDVVDVAKAFVHHFRFKEGVGRPGDDD